MLFIKFVYYRTPVYISEIICYCVFSDLSIYNLESERIVFGVVIVFTSIIYKFWFVIYYKFIPYNSSFLCCFRKRHWIIGYFPYFRFLIYFSIFKFPVKLLLFWFHLYCEICKILFKLLIIYLNLLTGEISFLITLMMTTSIFLNFIFHVISILYFRIFFDALILEWHIWRL